MITVYELAQKLMQYSQSAPGNGKHEVLLQYDGDVALEIDRGDTTSAMENGSMTIESFLVLIPNQRGKKLKMKHLLKAGNA